MELLSRAGSFSGIGNVWNWKCQGRACYSLTYLGYSLTTVLILPARALPSQMQVSRR